MFIVISLAAFVGFMHSLSPSHWLPVVMIAKARKWGLAGSVAGALVAASGHVALSVVLGAAGFGIAARALEEFEAQAERYAALAAAAFGLAYALWAAGRHRGCKGHGHHGPTPRKGSAPFLFLLSIGFSPCVAVLPVFATAAPLGSLALALTMAAFAGGVVTALVGATTVARLGLMKLDHPFFEHYGEVITGVAVGLMGLALFLYPAAHVH